MPHASPSIIVSTRAARSRAVERLLAARSLHYVRVSTPKQLAAAVQAAARQGTGCILCGGDGSVNRFLQVYARLPASARRSTPFGVLPCGKANDFARSLGMPTRLPEALDRLLQGRTGRVDLIRINDHYFCTGGSFGFPVDVVHDVNSLVASRIGMYWGAWLRDYLYTILAIARVFRGYEGLRDATISGRPTSAAPGPFMALAILNQSTIGRHFTLAPAAQHHDGVLEIVTIPRPTTTSGALASLVASRRGRLPTGAKTTRHRAARITTSTPVTFMADGEILMTADRFTVRVLPKELEVYR